LQCVSNALKAGCEFAPPGYNSNGGLRLESIVRSRPTTTRDKADQLRRDLAAQASAAEGIRQGLADLAAGRTRSAREVFDAFRAEHCIAVR
jgi:hypothetical protein